MLIRYLVQDDPAQSQKAGQFIEKYCTDDTLCFVGHITLCELAWVLERLYKQDRTEIASVIEELLQIGQLEVMDPQVVWQALRDYKQSNADFPDHLLARANEIKGCETTVTFDKKASRQPGFKLLQ